MSDADVGSMQLANKLKNEKRFEEACELYLGIIVSLTEKLNKKQVGVGIREGAACNPCHFRGNDQLQLARQPVAYGDLKKLNCEDEFNDDEYWDRYVVQPCGTTLNSVVISSRIKEAVRDAILLPLQFPEAYTTGALPKKALLLSGPNGTGKTLLVKAIGAEGLESSGIRMLCIPACAIVSKWIGVAENRVEGLFKYASKHKPIILFFDEVDSIFARKGDRESDSMTRVRNTFLQKMSGIHNLERGIVIIGTSNKPFDLDVSLHSRFDKEFQIPLPNLHQRILIMKNRMANMNQCLTEKEFKLCAEMTKGYSGRDLEHVMSQAQDEQYGKITRSTHFRINGCITDPALTHMKNSNVGTEVCFISPSKENPADPTVHKLDWKTVPKWYTWKPLPIDMECMERAILFCNRTTSEVEMLSLTAYYEEKRVHCYNQDQDEEIETKSVVNRFKSLF